MVRPKGSVPEGRCDRSLARSAWNSPPQKSRPVGHGMTGPMAKGAVRDGVQEKRFKSGKQWEVLRRGGAVIVEKKRRREAIATRPDSKIQGNSSHQSRQPGEDCRPSHC
jgi:hypothetical protein